MSREWTSVARRWRRRARQGDEACVRWYCRRVKWWVRLTVSGLDRAFVTEDGVSRGKGDIAEHAHVPECFGTHNQVVRAAPRTGRDLCHEGMFAGGVRAFGDGETGTAGGGTSENTEEKQWGEGNSPSERAARMWPLSLRRDAVRGSSTVATVAGRCAVQRLWELGAWVYMVGRTPAHMYRESRFAAACSYLSELRLLQLACTSQTRTGNWDVMQFPGFHVATSACWSS